jgi:predicted aconitase with swiveling domain
MAEPPRLQVAGPASGPVEGVVLRLDEPLSFWGGLDAATGEVIDRHHPQVGRSVTGRVLVMHSGRGSSSGSSILLEAVRCGTAPVAIVMVEPDAIVALGAIVASELYGVALPVVLVDEAQFARLRTGVRVDVGVDGSVRTIAAG